MSELNQEELSAGANGSGDCGIGSDLENLIEKFEAKFAIGMFDEAEENHRWYKLKVSPELATLQERVGHALVSSSDKMKIYMLGGGNRNGDLKEVWAFDYPIDSSRGVTGCLQEQLTQEFPGLYEFSCAADKNHDYAYVFGGATSAASFNNVYSFNLNHEHIVQQFSGEVEPKEGSDPTQIPIPRTQGHNSCYLSLGGKDYLAVFGGGERGEKALQDGNLYLYDIKVKTWRKVEVAGMTPKPVQGHGMVSLGSKIWLFGGMDNFVFNNDLYMIDLSEESPKWCKIEMTGPAPSPRAAHGIVALDNCFYICAGINGDDGALMDVWKYHTEALQWTCLSQLDNSNSTHSCPPFGKFPSRRADFAMTIIHVEVERSMILIHGGMNTMGGVFKDFWVFPLAK